MRVWTVANQKGGVGKIATVVTPVGILRRHARTGRRGKTP